MSQTARPQDRRRERRQEIIGERRQQQEIQRRKDRITRWATVGGTAIALALIVGVVLWVNIFREKPGRDMPSQGNIHVQPGQEHIAYNSDPPTSGPHLPNIARWGIHTEPIAKELQVHNLEDGGVIVQYNCPEGCPELAGQLEGIVKKYPEKVILAPYPDMDARIALTSWSRIDKFNEFDAGRVDAFIQAYRGIDHHPISGG